MMCAVRYKPHILTRIFSNGVPGNNVVSRKTLIRTICVSWNINLKRLWNPKTTMRLTSGSQLQHTQSIGGHGQPLRAVAVTKNSVKKWLDVTWNDGSQTSYPYVWLRDNCQCPACFHPSTISRLVPMRDLDPDIQPKNAVVGEDGNLTITWPDGHQTTCTSEWLRERSFTETAREKRLEVFGQLHKHWGAEMQDNIPTFDYDKITSSDDANHFLDWLTHMDWFGLALIRNAPTETTGHLRKIAEKICFSRKTNYGEYFEVESKTNPSNAAYTNSTLEFHSDLCFYLHVPGVQFLHCLKNTSTGGRNRFVDATNAAKIMENEYPEYYKLLCEQILAFIDIGTDDYKFKLIHQWPVFVRNRRGRVIAVRYNDVTRDSFMNSVPLENVQLVYKALKKLNEIMNDPKNYVTHLLKPGDIVVFDNTRVMHAREAYDVGSDGARHLEGMYLDWDDVRSRMRVLRDELGIKYI